MTIGEKLHRQREKEVSAVLEDWGFSLHRQGGLYQIEDCDLQPITSLIPLSEILEIIQMWRG